MNQPKREWNKEDIRNSTYRNKSHIEEMTKKMIRYYADDNKSSRKSKHLCKYCFYINTSRIGGCAITIRPCSNCEKEMPFSNTCTDVFCNKCAEELKLCKHCGAKMD